MEVRTMPDVRLIDANALQRAFDDAHKDKPDYYCCNFLNNAGNPSTEWDCVDDILENAPTIDAIPREKWNELKETIIEMRDGGGTAAQNVVCKFLTNLMEILEKEGKNDGSD